MQCGSSSKYKKQYCEQIIEFFSREPYKEVEVKHYGKDGRVCKTEMKRVANDLPYLSEFARHLGVSVRTLERWAKVHPEFSGAYQRAKELQKEFLITNGLLGLYNPTFAIFASKNLTDMRDQQNLKIGNELMQPTGVIILPPGGRHTREMLNAKALKEGEQKALPEGKQSENGLDVEHNHIATSQKKDF
jgi:hypothetical protein